jgi:hypothetical protein
MTKKIKPKMRVYSIMADAVETGVISGLNKARKYTDTPTDAEIIQQISSYVMLQLEEVIDFE